MKNTYAIAAVFALVVVTIAASETTTPGFNSRGWLEAYMLSYDEVPTVSSAGWGRFSLKVNGERIDYELRYRGLEGNAVAAHIHFGQPGTVGGVVAWLCGSMDTPPCPAQAGLVKGSIEPDDIVGPAAQGIEPGNFHEAVRAILVGATYANVHTDLWPAGEIRGPIRRGLAASETIPLP